MPTLVAFFLLLSACTTLAVKEASNVKVDSLAPDKSYLSFSVTLKGNAPHCSILLVNKDPSLKPQSISVNKDVHDFFLALPAGTYQITQMACGDVQSTLRIGEIFPLFVVAPNAIAFAGSFEISGVVEGETITMNATHADITNHTQLIYSTLSEQKTLPVVSAFNGKVITHKNWHPIKTFSTMDYKISGPHNMLAPTKFEEAQAVCFNAEVQINPLLAGHIVWAAAYNFGKFQALKIHERDDIVSDEFVMCMGLAIKDVSYFTSTSGVVTYSLN